MAGDTASGQQKAEDVLARFKSNWRARLQEPTHEPDQRARDSASPQPLGTPTAEHAQTLRSALRLKTESHNVPDTATASASLRNRKRKSFVYPSSVVERVKNVLLEKHGGSAFVKLLSRDARWGEDDLAGLGDFKSFLCRHPKVFRMNRHSQPISVDYVDANLERRVARRSFDSDSARKRIDQKARRTNPDPEHDTDSQSQLLGSRTEKLERAYELVFFKQTVVRGVSSSYPTQHVEASAYRMPSSCGLRQDPSAAASASEG